MSNFQLKALSPLQGLSERFGDTELSEYQTEILSIAMPLGGEQALQKAVQSLLGCALPGPGKSAVSEDGSMRIAWTMPDQFLLFGHGKGLDFENQIAQALGPSAYVTLQTDSWVCVKLSGPNSREALSRASMLDVHPDQFHIGDAVRGMMKHLNVLMIRTDQDEYVLATTSSAAQSFWEGLVHSTRNAENLRALKQGAR